MPRLSPVNGIAVLVTSLVLSGCTSIIQKHTYGSFEEKLKAGDLPAAAEMSVDKADVDKKTGHAEDLLWALEAGTVLRLQKGYRQSNDYFDDAETLMKDEDTENTGSKALDGISSLIVNDSVADYEQTHYDGIMANTYKAINFLYSEDLANARVEFNRVDDRQRRAAEAFSDKIKSLQEEQATEAKKNQKKELFTSLSKSQTDANNLLETQGVDFSLWKPYANYVNPFSTYMHGLFFLTTAKSRSDYSKAYQSLKRVASMTNSSAAKSDLKIARNLANGNWSVKRMNPQVWVVFANGLGPQKSEMRIDLPVYLLSDNIKYVGMALPKIKERSIAYPYLGVNGKKTTLLSKMDRVIQAEFKSEFPYILSREVVRTVLKTVAQKQLNDQSPMAGLVGSVLQLATTSADLRMWNSLPKEFQVVRMRKPKDGVISLSAQGLAEPVNVKIDQKTKFSIVYVRALSPESGLIVDTVNL